MPINKTVTGDLIQIAKDGDLDVIIHGCNCFNVMGAGIAKQISKAFPDAYRADAEFHMRYGGGDYTGYYSIAPSNSLHEFDIINAYTQHTFDASSSHLDRCASYDGIANVFFKINERYGCKTKIGIPKIGAGLAGGRWSIIETIINEMTPNLDITLVEYNRRINYAL